MIAAILRWLTGGILDRILRSVDNAIDNDTQREEIRARVIERYVSTAADVKQAAMQNAMFWRIWALFAAPLGMWWAAIMLDTTFGWIDWGVPMPPAPVLPYVDLIFQSLFGSGAAVGGLQAIASAIRGRR